MTLAGSLRRNFFQGKEGVYNFKCWWWSSSDLKIRLLYRKFGIASKKEPAPTKNNGINNSIFLLMIFSPFFFQMNQTSEMPIACIRCYQCEFCFPFSILYKCLFAVMRKVLQYFLSVLHTLCFFGAHVMLPFCCCVLHILHVLQRILV